MTESEGTDYVEDLHRQAEKYAFLGRRTRADWFGNVLFNSILQRLRGRHIDCRPSPLLGEKIYAVSLDLI